MSETTTYQDFSWDGVDFDDEASVSAVYGAGGGPWRRELVTITDPYYTPDHFLARGKPGREPEPGLVWELYFHDPAIRERHNKNVKPENRHWVESARFGFGRYADVKIYKDDGTLVDPDAVDPEDLKGDTFQHTPGTIWTHGSFMRLHRSIKKVSTDGLPNDVKEKWEAVRRTNAASGFRGLKCYLCQLDVEMDAKEKAERLESLRAKLRADGAEEEAIRKARYYPPTYIILDEVVEWEDMSTVAAYDPSAPQITEEAVAFLKEQIAAGVSTAAALGKAALNHLSNATLHPAVHAALSNVQLLAPHGIYWKNQRLSLEQ